MNGERGDSNKNLFIQGGMYIAFELLLRFLSSKNNYLTAIPSINSSGIPD